MSWIASKRIRKLAAVWRSLQRRPAAYTQLQQELLGDIRCLEERRVLNGAPVAAHGQGHAAQDNSQSVPGGTPVSLAVPGDGSHAHAASPPPASTSSAGHHSSDATGIATPPTNVPASEGQGQNFNLSSGNSLPATSSVSVAPQVNAATTNQAATFSPAGSTGSGNTISVPGPQTIDQDNLLVLSGVSLSGSISDTYNVSIDWGDGSGATSGTLVQDPTTPGMLDVQGQHAYTAPNFGYVVTIAVTDVTTGTVYDNGTFTVTVNSPPTATDLNFSTASDVTLNVAAPDGLLSGNTGSGPATAALLSDPTGADGTLTVNSDGSFQYVPNGQLGTDTFTYQVSDGIDTATANLIITTVSPLTDTTVSQTYGAVEGSSSTQAVLATFTDADPYAVASDYTPIVSWVGQTEATNVVVQELSTSSAGSTWEVLGTVTYAEAGTYNVTVQVNDFGGNSFTTTNAMSFVVADAALTDTTVSQTYNAVEGSSSTQVVLATFTDADPYAVASDYTATVSWVGKTEATNVVVQEISTSSAGSTWEVLGTVTYAEAGTYNVTVQVTDMGGNSFTTTNAMSFVVADAALTDTTVSQTYNAVEGSSSTQVVLATFTDADPYAVASDYAATVSWVGQTEATNVVVQEISTSSAGSTWEVLGTVTYAEAGTYNVTVQVTDMGGNSFTTTNAMSFVVADAALTDTTVSQTYNAVEGSSSTQVVLATFTDADPYAVASDYTATVSWVGQTEATNVVVQEISTSSAGSTWEVLGTVTYAEAGTYNVTVQVTDMGGNSFTTTNAMSFVVADAALTDTTVSQTYNAVEGSSSTQVVLATFTDADPYAVASDYTATVSWVGQTEATNVVVQELSTSSAGSTWEILGTVTYAEAGTYNVTVQVTDMGGNSFTTTNAISFVVADAALTDTTVSQSYNAVEGASTGQVVLATFTDADPYAVASDYTATVSWVGQTEATNVVVQELSTSSAGSTWEVLGTVTYAEAGTYNVTVQVNDFGGNSFTTTNPMSFVVADAALTDTTVSQTYNAVEGSSLGQVVLATFTDADPYAVASDYTPIVSWVGQTEATNVVVQEISTSSAGSTWEVLGTVTYAEAGTYNVTVQVNDFSGSTFTTTNPMTFVVADAALTDTTVSQTYSAVEGSSSTQVVLATFTDADPYAVASDYAATVSWVGQTEATNVVVQEISTSSAGSTWEVLGTVTYAEAGTYNVTVQVTDMGGNSFTTTNAMSFVVADAALTDTTVSQTYNAVEGSSIGQVVLATFTDADPYAVASDYTATISWVGQTEATNVVVQEVSMSSAGSTWEVLGTVTYAEAGTYNVTVQVTDMGGNSFTTTNPMTFVVADAALTDTTVSQTYSAVEGSSSTQVVLATFTDADPYAVAGDYTATVDWVGKTEATNVVVQELSTSSAGSTWEVLGTVTYAEAGTYNVTVQVTDMGGNSFTTTNPMTFVVADAALTDTTVSQTYSAVEGSSSTQVVLATFTDADPYAVAGDYTATVDWVGKTEATNVVVQELSTSSAGSTWEVLGTVTYAEAGTYNVTVQVTDMGGNSFTTTNPMTFVVADAPLTDTTVSQTYNAVEGSSIGQVVLATFTDADPYAVASDYTPIVSWVGQTEATNVVVQEVSSSATSSSWEVLGTVTYAEAGTYNVTVQVNDFGGSTFTTTNAMSFVVADAALTDTTVSQTHNAVEGASTGQVVLATFTDADPYAVASDYTPIVSWVGQTEATNVVVQELSTSSAGSTWEVLGTVTYAEAGTYNVTVQVTDMGGNSFTTTNPMTFVVADAALTDTTVSQTYSAVEGSSSTQVVLATFTDADPYAVASDYTPIVSWVGQTEATNVVVQEVSSSATSSSWEVLGTVTYAEAGTYNVTVQVNDFGGNSFTTTNPMSFVVADAPLTDTTVSQTYNAVEGSSIGQVVLATFTDADPYAVASDYTATISWVGQTEATNVVVQELSTSSAGSTWEVLGTVTYAEAGTYNVTVQVNDFGGNSFTTTNPMSFVVADAPLTDTTVSQTYNAVEGSSIGQVVLATFTDADPYAVASDYTPIVSWVGQTEATNVVVQEVSSSATSSSWEVLGTVTYAEAGTYNVTVQVNDFGGSTFTTTNPMSFVVADAALTDTTISQTYGAVEGSSSTQVVLATFTDADPYAVASDYTPIVSWVGQTEATNVVVQEISTSSAGSTWEILGTVTYAEAGTYNVTVQVTDMGGNSFTTTNAMSFVVADAALTDTTISQTYNAVEGSSSTQVVLATFTDADPYAVASDYAATVSWVGQTEATNVVVQELSTSSAGSTWEVLGTVTYAEAGTYNVTVQVTDMGGNSFTTTNPMTFVVADAALTDTTVSQTYSAVEGSSSTQVVLATFTDADPYAVAGDYTATVDWVGKTEATNVVVQEVSMSSAGSTWEVLGTVTYAEAGTYNVTVQVNDFGGSTFTTTNPMTFVVADAALTDTTVSQTYNAVEGSSSTQVVLATFTDADPYAVASDYMPIVNWSGEIRGTAAVTIQEVSMSTTSSTWEVLGSATYNDYGSYNVTVQVNDFGGSTFTTNNTSFSVSDPAVIVTPVTLSIPVGANSGVQTVATFTDPGGPEGLGDYSATINWGDGTPTVAGTIVFDATTGVFSVQGSHVYGYDVSYPITVTVSHDVAPNATAVGIAIVTDVPPTLTTTPTYAAVGQGSLMTLTNINFSDPAFRVQSNSPAFTYSIDWADGTPIQTGTAPITQFGSVGVPTVGALDLSHVYELAGSYVATLTVYDHDGEVATQAITIVIPEVPPVVSAVSFTELNILSQTTASGTVFDPGNDPLTVTIVWGDNSTTVLTLPGGVPDTFVTQHQYVGPPNPANPSAPISVTVAVNDHIDVFGRIEVGQVVTRADAVQVPGTGVVFVTFAPEPKAPPLALMQAVLTERSSFIASPSPQIATASELIVARANETGAAEDRVVLRLVSPDGKDANDVVLPGNVLDDLPGYLKRLPDGHYRVFYIQGDTHRERMIIDVDVRGGRPVDADEDSGGTQDRPPNARHQAPRPIVEEASAAAVNPTRVAPSHDAEFSRPDLRQPLVEALPEKSRSFSTGYGLLATSLLLARARSKAAASVAPSPADFVPSSNSRPLDKTARLMERVRKAYRPK